MSDSPPQRSAPPADARCAIHPEQLAQHTCVRCGNYMCQACESGTGGGLCLTCASRLGEREPFPYSRDHYDVSGLCNLSISRFKQHWQPLVLGFLACMLLVYGTSTLGDLWFAQLGGPEPEGPLAELRSLLHPVRLGVQVLVSVLGTAAQLVYVGLCIDVLQSGERQSLSASLTRLRALPAALLQMLVCYAAIAAYVGVGFGLFAAVGGHDDPLRGFLTLCVAALISVPLLLYVGLGFMYALSALAFDPSASAWQAIASAFRAVKGHRLRALLVSLVGGSIALGGLLLCCVGLIATGPVATLLFTAFYLALLRSEPRPALTNDAWPV